MSVPAFLSPLPCHLRACPTVVSLSRQPLQYLRTKKRSCAARIHPAPTLALQSVVTERESCVLVGVEITSATYSSQRILNMHDSLDELGRLADTAGLQVVGMVTQTLNVPNPSTYVGSGKVQEIKHELQALDCCTVIFDQELSPAQQRCLEDAFGGEATGVKVLDRTALILDIFAQHAATKEGQLQVELALYQYRLPRLTRLWTHLERQSGQGGVGLRGPGETQLEVDKRLIGIRMGKLKRDIEGVRRHRNRQRKARRSGGMPVVALVGYTNAGKSTLLNALTGSRVETRDALFATLDPTTRRGSMRGLSPEVLYTDTVGFVQNLPTTVVASFRATLEEVLEADLLLHVVDGSLEKGVMESQMEAVMNVLKEIGAGEKRMVVVVNKKDLMDDYEVLGMVEEKCGCEVVCCSALGGVEEVGVVVEEELRNLLVDVEVDVPWDRGDLVERMYREGCVEGEEWNGGGVRVWGKVPVGGLERLRPFMVGGGGERDVEREWIDLAKKRHARKG